MTYDLFQLSTAVIRDIPSAIRDLASIRTEQNRDKIAWAQYVLTACAELAKSVIGKN